MSTRIQLRGISRTPSDKMTADGGLAESLNIRLDNDECAPMIPPKDLTDSATAFTNYGLPPVSEGKKYSILYLHKQNDYQNYICSQTSGETTNVGIWQKVGSVYSLNAFLTLTGGETVKDVTAVGNTLVIYTDTTSYYAIYRNEQYELLGSKIPAPVVRIVGNGSLKKRESFMEEVSTSGNPAQDFGDTSKGWYMKYLMQSSSPLSDPASAGLTAAAVKTMLTSIRTGSDYFYAPTLLRVAIKLFDGYTNQSAPICIGAGQVYSPDIWIQEYKYGREGDYTYYYHACIRFNRCTPRIRLFNRSELEKWDDIIQSIDVFASDPIENPVISLGETTTSISGYGEAVYPSSNFRTFDVIMDGQYREMQQIEELVVSQNVFWKVLSAVRTSSIYDDDIATTWDQLANSGTNGALIKYPIGAVLHARDTLPDDYDSNSMVVADNAIVFNQRLILSGVRQRLGTGTTCFFAPNSSADGSEYNIRYKVKYFVTSNSSDSISDRIAQGDASSVKGKCYAVSEPYLTEQFVPSSWTVGSMTKYEETFGWISYPHPNCKKAILALYQGSSSTPFAYLEIEMKQHPKLSCSYAFFGFGMTLGWRYNIMTSSIVADTSQGTILESMTAADFDAQNPYLSYLNKMFYSEAGNPFSFPVANRQTFDGEVMACRVANRPMSTSQFGQFDLYVFTKNGIWSMTTTSVGTFNPPAPVSGDIALSAKAIQSMENSVIFTTSKGVMLIVGSEVSCLSTEMNGKHYTIGNDVVALLNVSGCPWQKFLPILSDGTPFMEFMQNARYAYDYAGNRILCFNEDEEYAYVYVLSSKTWHKISLPDGTLFSNVVNGFPATSISFAPKEIIWRLEAIPSDESKQVAVASSLVDNVDVERTQAEWIALLAAGDVDIYESDILDEAALASDLYDYNEDYTIVAPTHLLDYATYLEAESSTNLYGVMVTRPMDLDAPDVRKVIKDIRLRGKFNKNDVSYILLGSMDGLNYGVLSSLRGASCKSFRLVLLTKLAQAERLSYVEVEYGERFRNRLR